MITLNLGVDQHQQLKVPMVILNLGSHDLILGQRWLDHHDIWLDIRNRQLIWPELSPNNPPMNQELITSHEKLRPQQVNPQHQADVIQRDQAQQQEDNQQARFRILPRPRPPVVPASHTSFAKEQQQNLSTMN